LAQTTTTTRPARAAATPPDLRSCSRTAITMSRLEISFDELFAGLG